MTAVVYHIPASLVAAYRGHRVIVRAARPAALIEALPESELDNLVGVRLLSLEADVEPLADWGYGVPVELAVRDPGAEFPLLYRHAKLLDKHPVRVSMPAAPGCARAVRAAASLQFAVKLEPGQPDAPAVEEMLTALDYYLHHQSASQPIDFFHEALLAFYHHAPATLWELQEEDPALLLYVTDDGRETVARPDGGGLAHDPQTFVANLGAELLAGGGECAGCEFFEHCGGYFKWPRRDYDCAGVKMVFGALKEAAGELERDLAAFRESHEEARP